MDTIKRLSPRLKLQVNIVGAEILYMPPWFVPIRKSTADAPVFNNSLL